MRVVYSKGYLPNGCPTCDSPSFSSDLVFEDTSMKSLLYKIWDERYEYVYSNIYSPEGGVIVKVYSDYGRHTCLGMRFETIGGNYRTQDDGHGKTIIVRESTYEEL